MIFELLVLKKKIPSLITRPTSHNQYGEFALHNDIVYARLFRKAEKRVRTGVNITQRLLATNRIYLGAQSSLAPSVLQPNNLTKSFAETAKGIPERPATLIYASISTPHCSISTKGQKRHKKTRNKQKEAEGESNPSIPIHGQQILSVVWGEIVVDDSESFQLCWTSISTFFTRLLQLPWFIMHRVRGRFLMLQMEDLEVNLN